MFSLNHRLVALVDEGRFVPFQPNAVAGVVALDAPAGRARLERAGDVRLGVGAGCGPASARRTRPAAGASCASKCVTNSALGSPTIIVRSSSDL